MIYQDPPRPIGDPMLILVLDDQPIRHKVIGKMLKKLGHQTVHVKDYDEACKALKAAVYDEMFLDHDLEDYVDMDGNKYDPDSGKSVGFFERTGLDVVHQIVAMPAERLPKRVVIHSWNPDGALKMKRALQANGIEVIVHPFDVRWQHTD